MRLLVDEFIIESVRYKTGTPRSVSPPRLPPPAIEQTAQQRPGVTEGRRRRRIGSRAASRVARPELAFTPAPIAQAGLSTTLG